MTTESQKSEKSDENNVYIGKRSSMSYVMASLIILNKGEDCVMKARGRSISHAVDCAEILIRKFYPSASYKDIRISTEALTDDAGKTTNVSAIEIVITPNSPKK